MAYDYDQLVSDCELWMENNSVELVSAIPTCITMAMQSISKDLRVKALNVYDTAKTLTNGTATLAIPNVGTMLSMRSISVNDSGTHYKPLLHKETTYIDEYWPDRSVTGIPKYYGELDDQNWLFAPVPNANFALRISYRKQLATLVTGQTNWVVTNHYDFALSAVLLEASRFVMDDRQNSLISINGAQYVRLRDAINQMEKRTTRDEMRRPQKDATNAPSAPPDSEAE